MSIDALIAERLLLFIPLLLSLAVHEWAHAWVAWRLGDDTAARLGRMTLNPISHVDPLGTLLPPLLGVPFGWARPVPVEPTRFRRGVTMTRGLCLVALAGPASNALLAGICGSVLLGSAGAVGWLPAAVHAFLSTSIVLNLALAVFNLLPIPPLDGSRVADALIPRRFRPQWNAFCGFGPWLMLALILVPVLLGLF